MLNNNTLTHMPFLTYDNQNRRILFFTAADDCQPYCWKIFYQVNDDEPRRLETGFPHGVIECSPAAWQDESGWHISFIAAQYDISRLYRMDGAALDKLSAPVSMRIARTGFVYRDRIAIGEIQDVIHIHDNNGDHTIELPGGFLYRISYRADEPDKILISGDWVGEDQEPFTLEYNLVDDSQRFIESGGQGAYKCTLYGNEIVYAERTGTHFEKRKLRRTKNYEGIPCRAAQRRHNEVSAALLTVSKQCGCRIGENANEDVSRPSCLECVEKHLGAAFVISSEIHSGYAYRLRFIGHLHEAEDEAQEFPILFQLLRDARKNYQKEGTLPDWETLARTISEIKS